MRVLSNTVTTTGPGSGLASSLPRCVSAACRRDTPMEKPVAGTGSPRKRADEPVVAPAAADRAEADGLALVVLGLERQFNFVDRAGVVFEAADDGGIDDGFAGPSLICRIRHLRTRLRTRSVSIPSLSLESVSSQDEPIAEPDRKLHCSPIQSN